MNYAQFAAFIAFVLSVFFSGAAIRGLIDKEERSFINGCVLLGEVFLLGATLLVGELLALSLLGLYKAPFIWSAALLNYLFILYPKGRKVSAFILRRLACPGAPGVIFLILAAIFIFRNCYFLVDVDSHSTYLMAQKLWLAHGTSLIGGPQFDLRVFVPQFNAVPYSLGLSVFPQDTLFPQLVNLFWRLVAILLVFGYTAHCFNGYYGLAAVSLVLFNEHFFYSGANQWVVINGCVIALFFGAAYNFWEARKKSESFRFLMALLFLSQLLPNKYQMIYNFFFLGALGLSVQPELKDKICSLAVKKEWLYCLIGACVIALLWPLKNFIISGNPFFPVLAGKFGSFGWTPELEHVITRRAIFISPMKLFKFLSFFFIWPGVSAAKYVFFALLLFPFVMLRQLLRQKTEREELAALSFWLGLSVLSVIGICLTGWQDPRGYRYPIAVFSFTAVFSFSYILADVLSVKNKALIACTLIFLAFYGGRNEGVRVINRVGESFNFPGYKENLGVLSDKIHMDYIKNKHFPELKEIGSLMAGNKDKFKSSAWDLASFSQYTSAFLLPERPVVSLWLNTLVKWDSYENAGRIEDDLRKEGLEWVITRDSGKFIFISSKEYASRAIKFDRHPNSRYYDYGFPEELKVFSY